MLRLLAICAVVLAGLGAAAAQPMPYGPVPGPQSEAVPPPRAGAIWEPGHWHWNGERYVWLRGQWSIGGPRYGHYMQGHWGWDGGHWAWRPAHWE